MNKILERIDEEYLQDNDYSPIIKKLSDDDFETYMVIDENDGPTGTIYSFYPHHGDEEVVSIFLSEPTLGSLYKFLKKYFNE